MTAETPKTALSSLLHQVFCESDDILDRHGVLQYQRNGKKFAEFLEPLSSAFKNVSHDTDRDDIIIIIDALDECEMAQQKEFVRRIGTLCTEERCKRRTKFLITSRPGKFVRTALTDLSTVRPIIVEAELGDEARLLSRRF